MMEPLSPMLPLMYYPFNTAGVDGIRMLIQILCFSSQFFNFTAYGFEQGDGGGVL